MAEQQAMPVSPVDGSPAVGTLDVPLVEGVTRRLHVAHSQGAAEGEGYVVFDEQGNIWGHNGEGRRVRPYSEGRNTPTWTLDQLNASPGTLAFTEQAESEVPQDEKERSSSENMTARLSAEETDEYGNPLVLAKDGTTTFGMMDTESGLPVAPIRLSVGENRVDENGANHGYGLLHIEAGHGEQIRNAGYASVEEFVETVARNYTDIREGAKIGDNQTYLLGVTDEHSNTLFIQLSKDGSYWNVNSAGIFRKTYTRRRPKVNAVPEIGGGTVTDTPEVNSGQSEGATAPTGNSPLTSEYKNSGSVQEKQAATETPTFNKQVQNFLFSCRKF